MSFPFLQPYAGLSNSLQTAQAAVGGAVGGWVELGRTTLGSDTSPITVSSLSDKRYYMLLCDYGTQGTNNDHSFRLNNDSGSNYSERYNFNGGTDGTFTSDTEININGGTANLRNFNVSYLANISSKEKLMISHAIQSNTSGATDTFTRSEIAAKWANTSSAVNRIDAVTTNGGGYKSGDELVVLGWDPADTHTTNFWEELASVTTGSAGDTLQSGTISAKKYLWIQASYKNDGAADINALPRFNGDGGANYSKRSSTNGGVENTRINRTWIDLESGGQTQRFANMFIINNASTEKLCIYHQMDYGASGSGTAPNRIEGVAKWANTSSQITSIEWDQRDAGDYAAGAELRVWGAD